MRNHAKVTPCPAAQPPHARKPRRQDAALAKWRQAKAVELAQAGHDYDSIAREVGYANRGTAWRTVQTALRERVAEGVEEYRRVELERLDALHRAHWARALSGDLTAAHVVLRIIDQRIRLLGLVHTSDDAQAHPVSIVVGSG